DSRMRTGYASADASSTRRLRTLVGANLRGYGAARRVAPMHPGEPRRLQLAQLPTPLVPLTKLAKHLGIEPLLVKRDDLTGFELSGNKIRKLEYVLADAQQAGATT